MVKHLRPLCKESCATPLPAHRPTGAQKARPGTRRQRSPSSRGKRRVCEAPGPRALLTREAPGAQGAPWRPSRPPRGWQRRSARRGGRPSSSRARRASAASRRRRVPETKRARCIFLVGCAGGAAPRVSRALCWGARSTALRTRRIGCRQGAPSVWGRTSWRYARAEC